MIYDAYPVPSSLEKSHAETRRVQRERERERERESQRKRSEREESYEI